MVKIIKNLSTVMKGIQTMPSISQDKLREDIINSEKGDYNIKSTVKEKGAICFQVPDISSPLSVMMVEVGVAVIEGFGTAKVNFDYQFSDQPGFIAVPFGFMELTIPSISVSWRTYWGVSFPIPSMSTFTVRIPIMAFMTNVDSSGFTVMNVAGRTNVSYIAIGY